MSDALSLYIHVPFCRARCNYCDFNTYSGLESLFVPYVEAVCREIAYWGRGLAAHTVYLGGGTPTVLPVPLLGRMLSACHRAFLLDEGCEVSCEANPGTVSFQSLCALRALGVNRLSLGAQSFAAVELRLLGRIHSADEIVESVAQARRAGFNSVGLDLMYGLPGQNVYSWQRSLSRALALEPEHLSLYCLTVEEGTPLWSALERGRLASPDPDLAADMYELAAERLRREGYLHYELSNWARRESLTCRHNLTYWRNRPYLGFGAGAHSFYEGCRRWNVARPEEYIARTWEPPAAVEGREEISPRLEMAETMILGLRLVGEGVNLTEFARRFGRTPQEMYPQEVESLRGLGLLEWDDERMRLTPRAWLIANEVFRQFV